MAPRICSLQRNTTISAGGTEEEEVTQQENMAGMARMVRKIKKSKRQNGRAKQLVGGSANCWLLIVKKARLHPEWADTMQEWYNWLHEERRRTRKREEKNSARSLFHG